nr:hypothetical protein [Clostridia bacterium]
MGHAGYWVDNAEHLLHFGGRAFPCDREIIADASWKNHVLLLSADTDCLSLWDEDGLIRTARAGLYPQGMAVQKDTAYVCGGADGKLHLLSLPALHETAEFMLPGMPEQVCPHGTHIYVLSLLSEPEVHAALLRLSPDTGLHVEIFRFSGIPGALAAAQQGLWVGVSEFVFRLPWEANTPDVRVEGISLPGHIEVQPEGVIVTDTLEGRRYYIRT